ncbi:MAG: DUF4386 family protein [Actinomycetales bacterium]|nr:DUF4386 family protein [Actinomycetales bacterium]
MSRTSVSPRHPSSAAYPAPGSPSGHTRRVARIAGVSYLVMFVLAIVANFLVVEGLVVDGDAAATTANIVDGRGLFLVGVLGFGVIVVLDIVLSWALYVVFRPVDRTRALWMGGLRLAYSAMLAVAVLFLAHAFATTGATALDAAGADQVMGDIDTFQTMWKLGLGIFGLHLVLLGSLVIRSGFAPRVLGCVLVFAGVAYVADTAARLVLPDYESVAGLFLALVALPSMVGEGWLGFWLLLSRRIPSGESTR